MKLSVITCAHNPNSAYLNRVLSALRSQSLKECWEFVLIDNASSMSLDDAFDLSWQPFGRCVREKQLGLTAARLRGMKETTGEVLVYVDDDNVLEKDYLAAVLNVARNYPFLGSWGAGRIQPEFEAPPSPKFAPYLKYLALRSEDCASWSNRVDCWPSIPVGAGLCVRRCVVEQYARELEGDKFRHALDRCGRSLDGAGDIDLALTAARLQLGWGTFPEMKLIHIMPRARTQEDYLLRLVEASAKSLLIQRLRMGSSERPRSILSYSLGLAKTLVREGLTAAKFQIASRRGESEAFLQLDRNGS